MENSLDQHALTLLLCQRLGCAWLIVTAIDGTFMGASSRKEKTEKKIKQRKIRWRE